MASLVHIDTSFLVMLSRYMGKTMYRKGEWFHKLKNCGLQRGSRHLLEILVKDVSFAIPTMWQKVYKFPRYPSRHRQVLLNIYKWTSSSFPHVRGRNIVWCWWTCGPNGLKPSQHQNKMQQQWQMVGDPTENQLRQWDTFC